jgi:hypothetical protein
VIIALQFERMEKIYPHVGGTIDVIRGADHIHLPPGFRPEFIRLPKPGTLCAWTGLSRSKMWSLLETAPIKTVCLRRPGAAKGARLVHLDSLLNYLHGEAEFLTQPTTKGSTSYKQTQSATNS